MGVEENLLLMQTLDNAWNDKDWETFMKRHSENVSVYWPGQPEPTRGRHAHHNESVEFFKAFDNRLDNNPYKILDNHEWKLLTTYHTEPRTVNFCTCPIFR